MANWTPSDAVGIVGRPFPLTFTELLAILVNLKREQRRLSDTGGGLMRNVGDDDCRNLH